MQILRTINQMQRASRKLAAQGKTIGLVPTMGYLHEGHLALVRQMKKKADVVIVTIFVNPAQFGPKEDFAKYPRDEKADLRKIKSAGGDIVFIPDAKEIYPPDFQTFVEVENLSKPLEGEVRPGHFRGVTTVVAKLYNITRPDIVIFGQKDFQQAVILRQMTRDLGYPIKYIVGDTVREPDGLAMSSRNAYLSADGRREAVCLFRGLRTAREMVASGISHAAKIRKEMQLVIKATCPAAQIDYISFNDFKTLTPVTAVAAGTVCSLAVRLYGVRLIDNMKLK
jgi:pantoate--beta-alanine ligase